MTDRLKNKVAIITGGAQGIGKAVVQLFLEQGAHVIVIDRNYVALTNMRSELTSLWTERSSIHEMDITHQIKVQELMGKIISDYDRIDILVNNAGKNVFEDPASISDEQWEACYKLNLKGAWNVSQTILPTFIQQNYGNVVNIASVHGHKIIKGCFPYPVFKHGMLGLTKSLAIEYAANDIRFNSISPGLIMTPAIEDYFNSQENPEEEIRKQTELLPCKRIGQPIEVAQTVLFLASDEARYINGTDIKIDGGRSQVYHD